MGEEIDYTARYHQLVALCRKLALSVRGSSAKKASDLAVEILSGEYAIEEKLVEWDELEKE